MSKQYWTDSYQYKRILEILEDYWLSEPDEARVVVCMHFRKSNGEEQSKRIIWRNPNIKSNCSQDQRGHIKALSEVTRPECPICMKK